LPDWLFAGLAVYANPTCLKEDSLKRGDRGCAPRLDGSGEPPSVLSRRI
jgi:hypothetical protein